MTLSRFTVRHLPLTCLTEDIINNMTLPGSKFWKLKQNEKITLKGYQSSLVQHHEKQQTVAT